MVLIHAPKIYQQSNGWWFHPIETGAVKHFFKFIIDFEFVCFVMAPSQHCNLWQLGHKAATCSRPSWTGACQAQRQKAIHYWQKITISYDFNIFQYTLWSVHHDGFDDLSSIPKSISCPWNVNQCQYQMTLTILGFENSPTHDGLISCTMQLAC